LPIHHTTFMALRFVLRLFTFDCALQGFLRSKFFLSPKILIVFDFVHQKSG